MAALATQHDEAFGLSDVEMSRRRAGLHDRHASTRLRSGAASSATFCFVTGADAFKDIRSWKLHEALLDGCDFAVVSRPGLGSDAPFPRCCRNSRHACVRRHSLRGVNRVSFWWTRRPRRCRPPASVASSPNGGEWQRMVPPEVATYITRHGLYGAHAP